MVANVTKKGEEIATRFEKLKLFQTSPIKIPKLYVIAAAADVRPFSCVTCKNHPFTAQKMNFSVNDFFNKCDQIFNGKSLNGKLRFLCSAIINT